MKLVATLSNLIFLILCDEKRQHWGKLPHSVTPPYEPRVTLHVGVKDPFEAR